MLYAAKRVSLQTSIRPYWRCYYANTDAVIYVVDSADKDRIGISKQVRVVVCSSAPNDGPNLRS